MIQLTDKMAISSDVNQWMLMRPKKPSKSNPNTWEPYKYFHSLESCIEAAAGILLRTSTYTSVSDLKAVAEDIRATFAVKLGDLEGFDTRGMQK